MNAGTTAQRLPFVKMQALGNDFVVLDGHASLPELRPELLRRLADRRLGVGCDQILVVDPASDSGVDFGYRIFNADGSTVGQCGNGVRALALFVRRRGLSAKPQLRVKTETAHMTVEFVGDEVAVRMPVPQFDPRFVPINRPAADRYTFEDWQWGAVSMGNPHLVTQVADLDQTPVGELGRRLTRHADLPEGANIGFVQRLAADRIRLRVFERGAGETPACGSGACAAVAVLRRWGQVADDVSVELPGGSLRIRWPGANEPLWMIGPAQWVYEGHFEI